MSQSFDLLSPAAARRIGRPRRDPNSLTRTFGVCLTPAEEQHLAAKWGKVSAGLLALVQAEMKRGTKRKRVSSGK